MKIENMPINKIVSAFVVIATINHKKYNLVINLKKDMLGLSYKENKIKMKFTSFISISSLIENIEHQILDYKSKNKSITNKRSEANGLTKRRNKKT